MFALPISMPRFKRIIFYQNSPKIKVFLQKMQNFRALGAPPTDPRASGVWGLRPKPPISSSSLRISRYAPATYSIYISAYT